MVHPFGVSNINGDQKGEFVTSKPGHQRVRGQNQGNAAGGLLQNRISGSVTVQIIDLLEPIQVGHHQGKSAATLLIGNHLVGDLGKAATVQKTGEHIRFGERPRLGLCRAVVQHRMGHVAVSPPAEQDDRDIQQHCQGDQRVLQYAGAADRMNDLRQGRTPGPHEQEDGCHRNAECERIVPGITRMGITGILCHAEIVVWQSAFPRLPSRNIAVRVEIFG